jgi:hypothetical protein
MAAVDGIVDQMRRSPQGIRVADLCSVCDHFFGQSRQCGSSHRIYNMPWEGDPRVNIQSAKGLAKAYQVRQVLKAIERLKRENEKE